MAFGIGVLAGPLLGVVARRGNRRARADLLAAVPELATLDERDRARVEPAW